MRRMLRPVRAYDATRGFMNSPNFFIAGAPKCGTSALYAYLNAHPNIFISTPKEPQYFAEDLPRYRLVATEPEYLRLFKDCTTDHIARGEASTSYLFSSAAMKRIRERYPDTRIIAMLRDPVDMVYAWHAQCILNGDETEQDFARAWELQEPRRMGQALPRRCRHKELLLYKDWGMYSGQVERLFNCFPREQVRIIVFDDFVRDTRRVYEDVLEFLGVPQDGRDEFPRINENQMLRSKWIGNYLENPPRLVRYVAKGVKNLAGCNTIGLLEPLIRLNRKKMQRPRLPAEFRARLALEFKDDVRRLSALLDRDLDHWVCS